MAFRRHATAVVILSLLIADSARGATPAARCAATKARATAQYIAGFERCRQRELTTGLTPIACYEKLGDKLTRAVARAEAAGGCLVTGDHDALLGAAGNCVDQIATLTPATTTTTTVTQTTTSSCPPSTAFYCGFNAGDMCGFPALCPIGMTCQSAAGGGCECVGTAPACGSLQGVAFCHWGACPAGQTCQSIAGSGCPPSCGCQ